MKTETIAFTLPVWVLPVLINGDTSDTTEEEDYAIEALERKAHELKTEHGATHYHWSLTDDEPSFSHSNDLPVWPENKLGGNCETVNLVLMGVK